LGELDGDLAQERLYPAGEIRGDMKRDEVVGKSAALRCLLNEVETVAPTESTVLIYGETGTGKELVARALHNLSPRRSNAFVKVNCAAIPAGLLESELFGHERGAFTGAIAMRPTNRSFRTGNRGTVFLDEIGDVSPELQPKLLRVLQEREFERLGNTRTLRTDARLIAATNRDLAAMVMEQKFRLDLFYRLNVFPIRVPPLRDRRGDIPTLVSHFVSRFARHMNKRIESITSETISALCNYHWPGNIRELQNVLERAVILSSGPVSRVALSDVSAAIGHSSKQTHPAKPESEGNLRRLLEETERRRIPEVLDETSWVIAGPRGAAAQLGVKTLNASGPDSEARNRSQ
jgi:formate hydrogenlyase transcriptional activator